MSRDLPNLGHLAVENTEIVVKVTPKASRERIDVPGEGPIRIYVTAAPDKGAANRAVLALLAQAIGVPKSRLKILRGSTSRDKVVSVA